MTVKLRGMALKVNCHRNSQNSGTGGRGIVTDAKIEAGGRIYFAQAYYLNTAEIQFSAGPKKNETVITLSEAGGYRMQVVLFGQYVAAGFHLSSGSLRDGGTVLTYTPPASAHVEHLAAAGK